MLFPFYNSSRQIICGQNSHSCVPLSKERDESWCKRFELASTNHWAHLPMLQLSKDICQQLNCFSTAPDLQGTKKKHKDGSRIFINPQLEFVPGADSISASRYKFVDENRSGQTAIHTILKLFRILKEPLLWKFGYNSFLIESVWNHCFCASVAETASLPLLWTPNRNSLNLAGTRSWTKRQKQKRERFWWLKIDVSLTSKLSYSWMHKQVRISSNLAEMSPLTLSEVSR